MPILDSITRNDQIIDLEYAIQEYRERLYALLNNRNFSDLQYEEQLQFMRLNYLIGKANFDYFTFAKNEPTLYEKAILAFEEAYQLGDIATCDRINIAIMKIDNQNIDTLLFACTDNIAPEKIYLKALSAFLGCGENENANKGFILLQQAAREGHPSAQIHLSFIYQKGVFGFKDKNKAQEWLERGYLAAPNCPLAQCRLGSFYNENDRNSEGLVLWKNSANQGYVHALFFLSSTYIADNLKKTSLLRLTAFGGNIVAQYALAQIYLECHPKNTREAFYLFRLMSESDIVHVTISYAKEYLRGENDSVYQKYHALVLTRKYEDAAQLVVIEPTLLDEIILCDSTFNPYYNPTSPSDIDSMILALKNIKQTSLLNNLLAKAAITAHTLICENQSIHIATLHEKLHGYLSQIHFNKMTDFTPTMFKQFLDLFCDYWMRSTSAANNMEEEICASLIKCLLTADIENYTINDSSLLNFLGTVFIRALFGQNYTRSLGITLSQSDVMCLVIHAHHRSDVKPEQLNALFGQEVIISYPISRYPSTLFSINPQQTTKEVVNSVNNSI